MSTNQVLYATCIVLTGLLAGLFYGWQCSVINGLGKLGDREYLMSFQSLNKEILNPVFFLSFMGSLIALALTAIVFYKSGNNTVLPYLVTSLILYAIGVFGITSAFNVPLNNTVGAFDIAAATQMEITSMRESFELAWNKWHLIRTVFSVMAFVILIIPLAKKL